MPLLAGGILELPLGVLAGEGRRRRLAVLGGGLLFVAALLGVASARSFVVLLAAFVAFYPASGAFVSLTQADLMDVWPERQAKVMARWELAGMAGAVGGPLLCACPDAGALPGVRRRARASTGVTIRHNDRQADQNDHKQRSVHPGARTGQVRDYPDA